jgi:tetratricopeptide (TPR) repeat protein
VASLIADAVERNPAIPTYKAALAAAYLEGGNEALARELIDEAAAGSFSLPEDTAWFDGILNYARVALELKLRDHAEILFTMLAPFEDQVPYNGIIPQEPVAMLLGGLATVLDRYEVAEPYFEEAAELNARGGMRYAEAQTNLLWGRMLLTRNGLGDIERAREVLEQARSSAGARGYAMVELRATAALSMLT